MKCTSSHILTAISTSHFTTVHSALKLTNKSAFTFLVHIVDLHHAITVFSYILCTLTHLILWQVLAEGSTDEVFVQVSDIFENLPKRKSTSLHDYDVTFITGIVMGRCSIFSCRSILAILGLLSITGAGNSSRWSPRKSYGKKKTICDVVVTVLNQYKDSAITVSVVVGSVFS